MGHLLAGSHRNIQNQYNYDRLNKLFHELESPTKKLVLNYTRAIDLRTTVRDFLCFLNNYISGLLVTHDYKVLGIWESFSLALLLCFAEIQGKTEKQRALHSKDSGANYNSPSQKKKKKQFTFTNLRWENLGLKNKIVYRTFFSF